MARTSADQLARMKQGLAANGGQGATGSGTPSGIGGSLGAPASATTNSPFNMGGLINAANSATASVAKQATQRQAPVLWSNPLDNNSALGGNFLGAGTSEAPLQNPGNNLSSPGYDEQALLYTQNRLLEDPSQGLLQQSYDAMGRPTTGENYMNQNLGSLDGPGQGNQYWNQVQGQFNDPFAGEQYARQATANFSAQGPSSAFYGGAMGDHYDDYTNYSTGNAQGQYGMSAGQLAGGTAGENALGDLLGNASQNATYGGPNRAAAQYEQTQGAFGEMPIANFDPFFDRAIQLGTQDYNRQAAGRGVYGSSEALSGVGNVITDLNAQRALKGFDAEMRRAEEQRMRQQLLGEQARMGDLSGIEGFKASLQGAETYGNMANNMGRLELDRHSTLGTLANNADTQATAAQNARTSALSAFGTLANDADRNETDRYEATTSAMNAADQTGLERLRTGADIAFRTDENDRADYETSMNAANSAAQLGMDRNRQRADIATQMGVNDLGRLNSFNQAAAGAEASRQGRLNTRVTAQMQQTNQILNMLGTSFEDLTSGGQQDFENTFMSELAPALQKAGWKKEDVQRLHDDITAILSMGK